MSATSCACGVADDVGAVIGGGIANDVGAVTNVKVGAGAGAESAVADRCAPPHHFVPALELQAQLEARRYRAKWSDPKRVAEDNDAIMCAGGFLYDGHRVCVPLPLATTAVTLPPAVAPSRARFGTTAVCVANVDTLTAALALGDACALNHANAQTPGGRYRHGGRAQEEDLCRCLPQLWPALRDSGAYPIPPQAALVTRELLAVRRVGTYERCPSQGTVTIITAAMPCGVADRRPPGGWVGSPWAEDVTARIRAVLHAACATGHPNLVLGAFGCGAFGNPAGPVAAIFRALLTSAEFRGAFDRVVFAVLDPLGTGNLGPFRRELASIVDR